VREFRIYTRDITLQQATNLHNNRYTISSIPRDGILMPITFMASEDE
jgi:hypothetical protein